MTPQRNSKIMNNRLIANFIENRDLPTWLRGNSSFQKQAAQDLSYALRDDAEQETTHRVKNCLADLGLTPPIGSKAIHDLMELSRGSDLVFLWFLLESQYKTNNKNYSVNEQLIMTAIAHLDMVPTLRALDKLLPQPKPKPISACLAKSKAKPKPIKRLRIEEDIAKIPKAPISPYLQKQIRPKKCGKPLTLPEPKFRVNIKPYEIYQDPFYVVPNWKTRWFGDYEPHPGKRVVLRLVKETVDQLIRGSVASAADKKMGKNVRGIAGKNSTGDASGLANISSRFTDTQHSKGAQGGEADNTEKFTKAKLRECFASIAQEKKIEKDIESETPPDPRLNDECLCETHRMAKEMELRLKDELLALAKTKCDRYIDIEGTKMEERRKRIQKQIEADVECFVQQFRSSVPKKCSHPSKVDVVGINAGAACCSYFVQNVEENEDDAQRDAECGYGEYNPRMTGVSIDKDLPHVYKYYMHGESVGGAGGRDSGGFKAQRYSLKKRRNSRGSVYSNKNSRSAAAPAGNHHASPAAVAAAVTATQLRLTEEAVNKYGSYLEVETSSTPSKIFFKSATEHKPWMFDYSNIYHFKSLKKLKIPNNGVDVRQACLKALDSNEAVYKRGIHPTIAAEADLSHLVENYANETIKAEYKILLKNWKKTPAEAIKSKMELLFSRDYFDPDDEELMKDMLKAALEFIALDHHYVLASMPEAHKVPVLRHFIQRRYGKTYSAKERYDRLQESLKVVRALERVGHNFPVPNAMELSKADFISYSCHDAVIRIANRVKVNYYNELNEVILNQARIFWFAIHPYLCTGGPPRRTHYAYMPSRVSDIKRFHMWKPNEFKNARAAWEQRMKVNRKKIFK